MAKCFPILFVCIFLCIVLPKPFAISSLNFAWLACCGFPVNSVTDVLIHKTQELAATNAFKSKACYQPTQHTGIAWPQPHVPELVMDFYSPRNVDLSCDLQASSQGNCVFDSLGASIT